MAWQIDEERSNVQFDVEGKRVAIIAPSGGGGGDVPYIITTDDATQPSDRNLYSALKVKNLIEGISPLSEFFVGHYENGVLTSVECLVDLWTNYAISAKGLGSGGGGGGIDIERMWQELASSGNEQIAIGHLANALGGYQPLIDSGHKLAYSLLSGVPTSLPASDVYDWAKASTKPSYNLDEVSDGSTRKLADYVQKAGDTMGGDLNTHHLIPVTTNAYDLGSAAKIFRYLYARYIMSNASYALRLGLGAGDYEGAYITISTNGKVTLGGDFTPTKAVETAAELGLGGPLFLLGTGTNKRIYFDATHYLELDSNGYLHTNVGFYSDSFISAKGQGSGGGGGGIDVDRMWQELASTGTEQIAIGHLANALGGYQPLIDSSHKLAYSLLSGVPTSLPASDVYAWAKASTKPSYTWGEIGSRPTNLSQFTDDLGSSPTHNHQKILGAGVVPTDESLLASWAEGLTLHHSTAVVGNIPNYAVLLNILAKKSSGIRGLQIMSQSNGTLSYRTIGTSGTSWNAFKKVVSDSDFTASGIVDTLGTTPVKRATADASGNNIGDTYLNRTTSRSANKVYATPNGEAGAPAFRSLVAADIPKVNDSVHADSADEATHATDAAHADVATNADTLDGSHRADLIRQTASPTIPATKGWYTIATIAHASTSYNAQRSIYELSVAVIATSAGNEVPMAMLVRILPRGWNSTISCPYWCVNVEGGSGIIDKVRILPDSGKIQIHWNKAVSYSLQVQADNTYSYKGVREAPTLVTGTLEADSASATYAETCVVSGGFASSRNIVSHMGITAKQ